MQPRAAIASIVLAGALVSGAVLLHQALMITPDVVPLEPERLFASVAATVEREYLDSTVADRLYRLAADGLLSQLGDSSLAYIPPDRIGHDAVSAIDAVPRPAVRRSAILDTNVAYVALGAIDQRTASAVIRDVDALRARGATTLILDLRNVQGGTLDDGAAIADLFLNVGQAIAATRGRTVEVNRDIVDSAAQRWPAMPLILLINASSARAPEVVAGALQDHDRAVLVGTTSYGSGSEQSLLGLSGGGALRLTTALWLTPSGRPIERRKNVAVAVRDTAGRRGAEAESSAVRRTDAGRAITAAGGVAPDVAVGWTMPAGEVVAELDPQLQMARDVARGARSQTDLFANAAARARASAPSAIPPG